jgi:hypothetical protein
MRKSLGTLTRLAHRAPAWNACSAMVLFATLGTPARAEWLFDVAAGATYDSNLTRAANASDVRPGFAATFDVRAGQFIAMTGNDAVTLTADARGASYARYRGLDVAGMGATAVYRHKFGLGWGAPWAALTVTGAYDRYGSDLRDGARFDVRAEVGRRFTKRVDAVLGIACDRRYAPDGHPEVPGIPGNPFALAGQRAFVQAGYALGEQWLLSIDGAIRRGDVESTSQQGAAVFAASSAIAEDPAFRDPRLYAYRLRGTTATLGATLNFALNEHSSLDLRYRYASTRSPQYLDYRSNNVELVFAYRP